MPSSPPSRGTRRLLVPARVLIVALGVAILLGGCSSSQTQEVSVVAQRFYTAVTQADGRGACVLLSPATRTELEQSAGEACAQAVLDEQLPGPEGIVSARAYGTMAIVTAGDDTMFLSRFPGGWLVTGVGCQPTGQAERYDCTVTGG